MQQHSCSIQLHWVCSAAWKDCRRECPQALPTLWGPEWSPQPLPTQQGLGWSPLACPDTGAHGAPSPVLHSCSHLHCGPGRVVLPQQPVPSILYLFDFLFLQLQLTHQSLVQEYRVSGQHQARLTSVVSQ